MLKRHCCFYVILPLISIVGVLGVAWLIAAFIEIFTNNLTMIKILDSTIRTDNIGTNGHHDDHHEVLDDKNDEVFWFVQMSDLHLSKFRDYDQQRDFNYLCSTLFKTIKPSLIIITGDLTDAKDKTLHGSLQYQVEWSKYQSMIQTCKHNLPSTTKWLDVRGNHDSFNVPSLNREWNLYKDYGESKDSFLSGVNHYVHQTSYGRYAFTGVDLAPDPGPGRPYNFFAIPSEKTMDTIEKFSHNTKKYNGTIWYGHYPLSVTTAPHQLRKLLSSGIAYLCGHLHKMPFISNMHAIHDEGLMELELGDWKLNRRYRIGVFDHDVFAFTDVSFSSSSPTHTSTTIVFTNPIDARYMVQEKTPIKRMRSSTHIRFLFFHPETFIGRMQVTIDDRKVCDDTKRDGPLNTCPWSAHQFANGLHKLTVNVMDSSNKRMERFSIEFSLDGTRPPLGLASVIFLLTDFCTMLRMVFVVTMFLVVVIPIILKKVSHRIIDIIRNFLRLHLPYIYHVIECDVIFWKIILFNVVVAFGPQSLGYFVTDRVGVLFSYGIWSGQHFLPGTLTFLCTSRDLLFFNMMTVYCIGQILCESVGVKWRKSTVIFFIILTWYFLYWTRMFWIAYGSLSAITNTLSTWSIVLYFYLVRTAVRLKRK